MVKYLSIPLFNLKYNLCRKECFPYQIFFQLLHLLMVPRDGIQNSLLYSTTSSVIPVHIYNASNASGLENHFLFTSNIVHLCQKEEIICVQLCYLFHDLDKLQLNHFCHMLYRRLLFSVFASFLCRKTRILESKTFFYIKNSLIFKVEGSQSTAK